ncbi:MAG: hypothetical protein AB7O59_10330 [Pirellulales bacterium]
MPRIADALKRLTVLTSLATFGYIAGSLVLGAPYMLNLLLLCQLSWILPFVGIGVVRRRWVKSLNLPTFFTSLVPNISMFTTLAVTIPPPSLEVCVVTAAFCIVPGMIIWPFAWNIARRVEFDRHLARHRKRRNCKHRAVFGQPIVRDG